MDLLSSTRIILQQNGYTEVGGCDGYFTPQNFGKDSLSLVIHMINDIQKLKLDLASLRTS